MKKRKFAFSLVEALVLLAVVSIGLAAITPLITRKIVNNTDPGTAPGGDSHGRYECYTDSSGTVRERMYSGSTKVYDQPASAGKCNFIPPANAANFVIYAVGGGGAGGGAGQSFINSYQPTTQHGNLDVRTGSTFPQDIMKWTSKLGSQTQNATLEPMPEWFNWNLIKNSGFEITAVGCGGAGGHGGNMFWSSKCDWTCIRNAYTKNYSFDCTYSKDCPKTCTRTKRHACPKSLPQSSCGYDCRSDSSSTWDCAYTESYSCPDPCCRTGLCSNASCNATWYRCTSSHSLKNYSKSGDCSGCVKSSCESITKTRTDACYSHSHYGGSGGAAPKCVWLSKVVERTTFGESSCSGGAQDGSNVSAGCISACSTETGYSGRTTDGTTGKTCRINIDGGKAYSLGGHGGQRCRQPQEGVSFNYNGFFFTYESDRLTAQLGNVEIDINKPIIQTDWIDQEVNQTGSDKTGKFMLGSPWGCKALPSMTCGKSGSPGSTSGGNTCTGNFGKKGTACSTGLYNELYTWSTPSATKYLGYGEAGKPGNFEILKVTAISQPLQITLGTGGTNSNWKAEGRPSNGENGTNTTVGNILVAKGGSGGKGSLKTNKYELCHMLDRKLVGTCSIGTRTTDDIEAVKEKPSGLSNIGPALVGGSDLIGGGYGKGGMGGGSQSLTEYVCDLRNVINTSPKTKGVSGYESDASRTIYSLAGSGCPADAAGYKNTYLQTSAAALNGGNGAVIITW